VIFNCLLKLTQHKSEFYIIECISRIIKVTESQT